MALELGGRADKAGNRYELMCIIDELLNLVNETKDSVVIEAIGDDETGTDILVTDKNGIKEHQQCKLRNASKEYWTIGDLKARGVMDAWHMQLNRGAERHVALVSPIGCSALMDLNSRVLNTNGNPDDFYEYQIKTSKDTEKFYKSFCEAMNLDCTQKQDIRISMDYLRRIHMKQCSEDEIRERLRNKIGLLFCTDEQIVYNAIVTFVIDNHIWGREITIHTLLDFFQRQGIEERNLEHDSRMMPTVTALNQEYSTSFKTLREGLIPRSEFETCIHHVENENSFIISGSAGCGKSGCTEAIIRHCQDKEIPYLAIKLDRKMPKINSAEWEKQLGFPCSVAAVLDAIAKSTPAVLILDQLDALRWTQANSYEAVSVCMQLIKKVENLNRSRTHKIVMIFVCRSYDLKNDANIKSLFVEGEKRKKWENVEVGKLDESTVRTVVGQRYETLREKTKQLLRTPSNLYIWQHLDEVHTSGDCQTTSHLIDAWYDQIRRNSDQNGVSESVVRNTLTDTVQRLDQTGRLYLPERILDVDKAGLDYLISAEMLVRDDGKIGFAHQSIFDYFVSKRMMEKFYDNCSIEEITGTREHQTPSKRYQIQMFLQNLLECSSGDFVQAGKAMLESPQVRYYVKYLFYELLGQIQKPDEVIRDFILENCEEEPYAEKLISQVFMGNHGMIHVLLKEGILQKWYEDPEKKEQVFVLLRSVGEELDDEDAVFIRKNAFRNAEDDRKFIDCFWYSVVFECDAIFELRMEFYEKYPELLEQIYIEKEMNDQKSCRRKIRLLEVCLKNKKSLHTDEWFQQDDEIDRENAIYAIRQLIKYLPAGKAWEIRYGDWSERKISEYTCQRTAVDLLKKAFKTMALKDSEEFWNVCKIYMKAESLVKNEIILYGLRFLPEEHSDQIMEYLALAPEENCREYTSGECNELNYAKDILKKCTAYCTDRVLEKFEEKVANYCPADIARQYKWRKERKGYWPVWGELQYELLPCIPAERLSSKSHNLLKVLNRRFEKFDTAYKKGEDNCGWVASPVAGKNIGSGQWLQIITNQKMKTRKSASWKSVEGGFIESSLETYARDFTAAVKENIEEMIQLVLKHQAQILTVYIESLYAGIAFIEHLDTVSTELLEELFRTFPCGTDGTRSDYFCEIILKTKNRTWSEDTLETLKQIAVEYKEYSTWQEEKNSDAEKLFSCAINCTKGTACRAIGHLLEENPELFTSFRDTIEQMAADDHPIAKMSALFALYPIMKIDLSWAAEKILRIYQSDVRMLAFRKSKGILYQLYPEYSGKVSKIIRNGFDSTEEILIEMAGCTLCELYMMSDAFAEIVENPERLNELQVNAILQMSIAYLRVGEKHEKAKMLILSCKDFSNSNRGALSRIFREHFISAENDAEFLLQIMSGKLDSRVVYDFSSFLEAEPGSVKEYAELILTLCRNILSRERGAEKSLWRPDREISKLVLDLYDECAGSAREKDKKIAEQCLDLWDMMFEKQIGQVRMLSRELMER